MRIYLDNCALGRLTDDQSQGTVRQEAEAVSRILSEVDAGTHLWIASDILLQEVSCNRNVWIREAAEFLIRRSSVLHPTTPAIQAQARFAAQQGLHLADALHLAAALGSSCDVLLTTDVRFLRQSMRLPGVRQGFVLNPVTFLPRL